VEDTAAPDETTFTLPPAWARQAEAFRGRRPAPALAIDADATLAAAAELRQRVSGPVRRILDHPSSDRTLVKRAELHAGTRTGFLRRSSAQQDDPVGAAVLTMATCTSIGWHERQDAALLADELVVRHGPAFAAVAGAGLATVVVTNASGAYAQNGHIESWVSPAAPGQVSAYVIEPVLSRLRSHLTAIDDDAYAQVVRQLADARAGSLAVRVVTSYLAPTEQAWVDEDVAALGTLQPVSLHWPMLLASTTTRAQVEAVIAAVNHPWSIVRRPELLASIAANLGTDAAGPLIGLFDHRLDAATSKRLLKMVSVLPTDEAFAALLDRIDQKYVQPVVLEAMGRFPARAMRLLAAQASGNDAKARACQELLPGHVRSYPALAEQVGAQLDTAAAAVIASAGQAGDLVPVADPASVPPILAAPPWLGRSKAAKPVVVAGLAPPAGMTLRWLPGEQAEWAARPLRRHHLADHFAKNWRTAVTQALDPRSRFHSDALHVFATAPDKLVRPHLATFTPPLYLWDPLPAIERILGRFGDDAVAFTERAVATQPTSLAPALLPIEGAPVASRMADWFVRAKTMRPLARTWLARHPETAARDLIPAALAKPGKDRTAAEAALRFLDQAGHRDVIRDAAGGYGTEVRAAIEAVLDVDPLLRLPARIPALPAWLDPSHLPQVLVPGRAAALPPEAVGHLCTMLAISKPDDPYAGIALVKDATDPISLAELAWGLLERWQGAGYPSKAGWVLDALGLVGNDETVRRLTALIRTWPGEGAHARAVAALDVLSAIGTDVALLHLHGIAEKSPFRGLRSKAREKMDEVAEGLGLSAEQLADRLVPDFGLARDGSMLLDYGPRRFRVGFDEQLKPVIADEHGARRKTLPKPAAKDDPALAPAAYATFRGLRKDVKTIAADQLRRFERAMVAGRRWTAADQRALFIEHPLLWHLTRRLVWATFDDTGEATGSFRVAEDRTLADAGDEELTLPDRTLVGIAHPLHLGGALAAWSEVFADYEILQPFPQLDRDTWHLTDAERQARVLHRLDGVTVETGRILGLAHRGWERGPVMDGGVSDVVHKPVAGGHVLVINLDPGIIAGAVMEWKTQQVRGVWISDGPPEWVDPNGNRPFSVLDPVSASELLRDLEHLRG
jgi:hypothetical protein